MHYPLYFPGSVIYDIPYYLQTPVKQPAITFYKLSPILEIQLETAYCNCMPKTCVTSDTALARLKEMTSRNTKNTKHISNGRAEV